MAAAQYVDVQTDVELILPVDYSQLRRGDQLAVEGNMAGIGYYHHGIYLGNGEVVDFGGANKTSAAVRKISIDEFTDYNQRNLVRILYPAGQCFSPEQTAQNAEAFAMNPSSMGTYNLLVNNCEHFATKCKTGYAASMQVIENMRSQFLILIAAVASGFASVAGKKMSY